MTRLQIPAVAAEQTYVMCQRAAKIIARIRAGSEGEREALEHEIVSLGERLDVLAADPEEVSPFDAFVEASELDGEQANLLLTLVAWEILPEFRAWARDVLGLGETLRVGDLLALLHPGLDRRGSARLCLLPSAQLVASGVVELNTQPLLQRRAPQLESMVVGAAPHVVEACLGNDGVPPWAASFATLEGCGAHGLDALNLDAPQALTLDMVCSVWEEAIDEDRLRAKRAPWNWKFLLIKGGASSSSGRIPSALASDLGLGLLSVDLRGVEDLSTEEAQRWLARVAVLARHHRVLLHLEHADALVVGSVATTLFLKHCVVPTIVTVSMDTVVGAQLEALSLGMLSLPRLTAAQRHVLWRSTLAKTRWDDLPEGTFRMLARRFRVSADQIDRATALASADPDITDSQEQIKRLEHAAQAMLPPSIGDLTVRQEQGRTLEDLILPKETADQVRDILEACRHRVQVLDHWGFSKRLATGIGIIALFGGPPGTGKTLTASIIASQLGLPLYQVSLPKLVNKYIGETEKNIERLFQASQAIGAVLLFDEADALFAKRVTVESSNDRHSNMQTNTLLQEIEAYDGIVLLTTNLEVNLDAAFERRIHFRVPFPAPGPDERTRLWEALMPPETPIDGDIDFKKLGARFELSGGQTRNALLRAAYRAATRGVPVSMEIIKQAAMDESRAAGKLFRVE